MLKQVTITVATDLAGDLSLSPSVDLLHCCGEALIQHHDKLASVREEHPLLSGYTKVCRVWNSMYDMYSMYSLECCNKSAVTHVFEQVNMGV